MQLPFLKQCRIDAALSALMLLSAATTAALAADCPACKDRSYDECPRAALAAEEASALQARSAPPVVSDVSRLFRQAWLYCRAYERKLNIRVRAQASAYFSCWNMFCDIPLQRLSLLRILTSY